MKTYDELLAENEALSAKFALLASLAKEAAEADESKDFLGHDWHDKYYDECTSAQCLAEIKAEAVESAIKYCNLYLAFPVTKGDIAEEVLAISEIKMHAAKIRNAGTWLKDSNVNGGKRQGGE